MKDADESQVAVGAGGWAPSEGGAKSTVWSRDKGWRCREGAETDRRGVISLAARIWSSEMGQESSGDQEPGLQTKPWGFMAE